MACIIYMPFGFCAMALLPIWACIRFFRKKQWEERPNALLLVCFFVTVTFISVICMLMTNLDNTGRYLMVAIYCGFLVLPILLIYIVASKKIRNSFAYSGIK